MFLTDRGPENVTFHGLQKSITARSHGFPPKKKVCKDGNTLIYCGNLPIGPSDLGIVPMINDISWNSHQKTTKETLLLACTGTFGTVTFRRTLAKYAIAENVEEKWNKVQLSTDTGKLCKWCPAEGHILAVGIINEFNQGVVKLIDSNNKNSQDVFTGYGGSGLNSLSWNKSGEYLLITVNDSLGFAVVNRTLRNITCKKLDYLPFDSPTEEKPNLFGVFHPALNYFFVASAAGEIRTYRFITGDPGSKDGWYRKNLWITPKSEGPDSSRFCGISIDPSGDRLMCIRSSGAVLLLKIDYALLVDNHMQRVFSSFIVLRPEDLELPDVSLSLCRGSALTTMDRTGLIKVYAVSDSGLVEECENKKDIDCTKRCSQLNALVWNKDVIATGGEDGLIHFWIYGTTDNLKFAPRVRDIYSEKMFYRKKKLDLVVGVKLTEKFATVNSELIEKFAQLNSELINISAASTEQLNLVVGQNQKGASLARDVLKRIHQGQTLSPEETRKFAEDVLEALTTID